MQRAKYAPEFKEEAVKQVVVKGHPVVDVAKRQGVPCSGVGSSLACCGGVEYGVTHTNQLGVGCAHDGGMAQKA